MSSGQGWLLVGLGSFGVLAGTVGGLSASPGTGTTLLTSLLTFGGGTITTFASMRKTGATIVARAAGQALCVFSLGVGLGLGFGIAARMGYVFRAPPNSAQPVQGAEATNNKEGSPSPSPPGPRLEASAVNACAMVAGHLARPRKYLDDLPEAQQDVESLYDAACAPGPSSR